MSGKKVVSIGGGATKGSVLVEPKGKIWERAKEERNWMVFGLFGESDLGKVKKRPVLRGKPWVTVGAQRSAVLKFDEAAELVRAVDSRRLERWNEELRRSRDGDDREKITGVKVGYLAREGSAMTVIDLDECLDRETGELVEGGWWDGLIDREFEGYAEVSVSGNGLRVLCDRQEGDEELSSGSEKGGGAFVAKGEKGVVLNLEGPWGVGREVGERPEWLVLELVRRRGDRRRDVKKVWDSVEDQVLQYGVLGLDDFREMLEEIPNKGIDRNQWVGLMGATKDYFGALGLDEEAWALVDDWTARQEDGVGEYDEGENRKVWDGLKGRPDGSGTTMASWFWLWNEARGEESERGESEGGAEREEGRWAGREDWWERLPRTRKGEKKILNQTSAAVAQIGHEAPWMADFVRPGLVPGVLWRMRDWETGEWLEEPREWNDGDDVKWVSRIESWEKAKLVRPFLGWSARALSNGLVEYLRDQEARGALWDPIRADLERIERVGWDGERRLDGWLERYCGAVGSSEWNAVAGRKFLVGMVARGMNRVDGAVKMDTALILRGAQGIGKSTMCEILSGGMFTDKVTSFEEKDAAMEIGGKWVVELGEGVSMSRSSMEETKAFLSRTVDRFRPPYGRRVVSQTRKCVFVITTNEEFPLKEAGRRFWGIECGVVDLVGLRRDRDQLLAEAICAWKRGEKWWLEDGRERELWHGAVVNFSDLPWWSARLAEYVQEMDEVSIGDLVLQMADVGATRSPNAIAGVLKEWGWVHKRTKAERFWVRGEGAYPARVGGGMA